MELNHFTETFTVLNADGDFRRMLKPQRPVPLRGTGGSGPRPRL